MTKNRDPKTACGCTKRPCIHDLRKIDSVDKKLDKILDRFGDAPTPEEAAKLERLQKARKIIARVVDAGGRVTLAGWYKAPEETQRELVDLFGLGAVSPSTSLAAFLLAVDFGLQFKAPGR